MKYKVIKYVNKQFNKFLRHNGYENSKNFAFLINEAMDKTAVSVLDQVGNLEIPMGKFERYLVKDMQGYKEIRKEWDYKFNDPRIHDFLENHHRRR